MKIGHFVSKTILVPPCNNVGSGVMFYMNSIIVHMCIYWISPDYAAAAIHRGIWQPSGTAKDVSEFD